jgi:hypothetical protein
MKDDELRYTVYELNKWFPGGRLLLLKSRDFTAARAAFTSLVEAKPDARLLWREWSRILGETHPDPPAPRANEDDFRDGLERKSSMCGRYALTLPPEAMRQLFGASSERINFGPRYNAAPTQQLPVIRYNPDSGIRSLDLLRWGFIHRKAPDLRGGAKAINARAEGVATKWPFSEAFVKRRALVPASAFYEWKSDPAGKQPYAIGLKDGGTMAFAGVWQGWKDET